MQGTQQRDAASAGRIAVLSRQLTNAGMAEVAQAAPEAYRLCAEAADVYAWLTRDNFELRQAIFKFLKVSGTVVARVTLSNGAELVVAPMPPRSADAAG
jgi:hypothetical protein